MAGMARASVPWLLGCMLACGGDPDAGDSEGTDGETTAALEGGGTTVSTTAPATTAATTTGATTTDPGTTAADDTTDADGSTDDGADGSTGAGDACPVDALAAGQYDTLEIEHDGVMRSYNLYVPAGVDGSQPIPLVLNFHGYLSNPGQQQAFS